MEEFLNRSNLVLKDNNDLVYQDNKLFVKNNNAIKLIKEKNLSIAQNSKIIYNWFFFLS